MTDAKDSEVENITWDFFVLGKYCYAVPLQLVIHMKRHSINIFTCWYTYLYIYYDIKLCVGWQVVLSSPSTRKAKERIFSKRHTLQNLKGLSHEN